MSSVDAALEAFGSQGRDNPYPLFAELRARGPVHEVTLADGHRAYLIVGFAEARLALNDRRLSKDMHAAQALGSEVVAEGLPGPALARHMVNVDPPDHTRLRRLVSAAFAVRRIEDMRPQIEAIVDDLLDGIASRGPEEPVDLVSAFAFPLPFTVICEVLGVPETDRALLGEQLRTLLAPTTTPDEWARAKVASDGVVAMLTSLVETKRDEPADDLISELIRARDGDERLTTQELLSTIFQLIVAGHDTTTSLIGNAVVSLLRNPEQLELLRADPALMARAVEEFLRYDAPVPHSTFRYAAEPVEIAGVTIPQGVQVLISLASADRDESRFTDADALDVQRPELSHLAFGHGIHFCLGAPLARLEGNVALSSLLSRFPQLHLAVPADALRWGHGDGLVLRGLSDLPVIPGRAEPR
jgi:cytochrome P450